MCRVLVVLLVQTRTLNHELRHVALAPESLWTECLRGGGSCSRSCADLPDVDGFFLVDRPVANEFGLVHNRVMRRDRACIANGDQAPCRRQWPMHPAHRKDESRRATQVPSQRSVLSLILFRPRY